MTTNEASRVLIVSYGPPLNGEPGLTMPSGFFLWLSWALSNGRPSEPHRMFRAKGKGQEGHSRGKEDVLVEENGTASFR